MMSAIGDKAEGIARGQIMQDYIVHDKVLGFTFKGCEEPLEEIKQEIDII